ncbi:MAG: ATP-binding cassette domain-containing protein, partial [Spirochaetia bacterium]
MSNSPLLKVSHITKHFANVTALDDVSFDLHPGEILALLGENGAGKSTLVNILCGLLPPDTGEIVIEGTPVKFANPQDAYNLGITVIHQELNLARDLKVAENIFLGDKPKKKILGLLKVIDFKSMYSQSESFLKMFGCTISPRDLISDLSPTEQQLLEILKGMRRQSRIFLMDEP